MQFSSALKRTIYNFKNSFFPNFVSIHRAKYIFPETCFAYTISEPKFTVWRGSILVSMAMLWSESEISIMFKISYLSIQCNIQNRITTNWAFCCHQRKKDFKNSFSLYFAFIHRAKYIFSRDIFCLYYFRAKVHSTKGLNFDWYGHVLDWIWNFSHVQIFHTCLLNATYKIGFQQTELFAVIKGRIINDAETSFQKGMCISYGWLYS